MQSVTGLTLLCLIAIASGVTQNNKKILDEKTKPMYIDQATKEALAVARIRERSREELEYKQIGKALKTAEDARSAEALQIEEAHEREIQEREIRETNFKESIEQAFNKRSQGTTDNRTQQLYRGESNLETSKDESNFRRDVSEAMRKSQLQKYLNLEAANKVKSP